MEKNIETKKFDAEVGKILHLMINSIYTNKDIFIRELISNSSDACDKLRYLSQQNEALSSVNNYQIYIILDKEGKTITVSDNGIGMNREELSEYLGTIAKSGTHSFIEQLSGDQKKDSLLIGQFGVGFYSSFMVADRVTVRSKKAGEKNAYSWESDGKGEYVIMEIDDFKQEHGTDVVLHIKNSEESLLDEYRIKHIVKSYSDHVGIPIFFLAKEISVDKKEKNTSKKKEKEVAQDAQVPEQLNSASALWKRAKVDVTDEQYKDFYQAISHAPDDPWLIMHNKNEGLIEFTNLLFIPSSKTFDLFHPDRKCRIKLYIKRVFIADENIDLVPKYMRFLRGVVDCEDLPLNISRETLQHNSVLEKVKNAITKKVIAELKKKLDLSLDDYLIFWKNFGVVLKEGLCEITYDHEKLLEVCLFASAKSDKMITLDEYIKNAKEDQKTIYYLSGENINKLRNSPHIENLLAQELDVLLFTDTVDDFWVNTVQSYKGYGFSSATKSPSNKVDTEDNKDLKNKESDDTYKELIEYFKNCLGDLVKDIKISTKLKSSPVCLTVAEGAMDMKMERFLIEQKQLSKPSAKILELNINHEIIQKINHDIQNKKNVSSNTNTEIFVHLLYAEACIDVDEVILDPGLLVKKMNTLMTNVINLENEKN